MKRNRFITSSEIFSLLIASLLITAFGWYLSRGQVTNAPQIDIQKTPVAEPIARQSPETPKQPKGSLLIERLKNDSSSFYLINLVTKDEKYIYTDSDETKKVILPLSADKNSLYVIEADNKNEDLGTLASISLDGKAKKRKLAENIPTAPSPLIDTLNQKIFTVSFSPVEKNFGFSLKLMNFDGTNSRTIKTLQASPNNLVFTKNFQNLYYSHLEGSKNKIVKINLNGEVQKQVDIDGIVIDMTPVGDDLLLSLAPFGNGTSNKSKLVLLNSELIANETNFKDIENTENYLVEVSESLVSFASLNYSSGIINLKTSGDIYLVDTATFESTKLTSGSKVIGFFDE